MVSLVLPTNARGPILDLFLPVSEDAVDVVLRNVTTGKTLTLSVPAGWDFSGGLALDFENRTIRSLVSGVDFSALLSPTDNELWTVAPLIAGVNDVEIEAKFAADADWLTAPSSAVGIAMDATYIYWSGLDPESGQAVIGRVKLDGSGLNGKWIEVGGVNLPTDVAVNATHVFWSNPASGGSIGRAKIDGSEVTKEWLTTPAGSIAGLAVDATYIYWASPSGGSIGRAKIGGTEGNDTWLTAPSSPTGLAVDATYIYWSEGGEGEKGVGRAKLSGSEPDAKWISASATIQSVAVDATHIYWTDFTRKAIGRALLNGGDADYEYLPGSGNGQEIAVNSTQIVWAAEANIGRAVLLAAYGALATLRWIKAYY